MQMAALGWRGSGSNRSRSMRREIGNLNPFFTNFISEAVDGGWGAPSLPPPSVATHTAGGFTRRGLWYWLHAHLLALSHAAPAERNLAAAAAASLMPWRKFNLMNFGPHVPPAASLRFPTSQRGNSLCPGKGITHLWAMTTVCLMNVQIHFRTSMFRMFTFEVSDKLLTSKHILRRTRPLCAKNRTTWCFLPRINLGGK